MITKNLAVVAALFFAGAATVPAPAHAARAKRKTKTMVKAKAKPKVAPKAAVKAPARPKAPADDSWQDWKDDAATEPASNTGAAEPKIIVTKSDVDAAGPAISADIKPVNLPVLPDGAYKTGVYITPVTRNSKESAESFEIARGGQALVPIVISDKATLPLKNVVKDLKSALDKMTGGTFEIKEVAGNAEAGSGIVIGTRDEFPTPALNSALEVVNGFDGREAYAIRTTKSRVLLLGATDQAAGHAVYRLLDEMGWRWFFMNPVWNIVPDTKDLSFQKDITDRPTFLSRDVWAAWSGGNYGWGPGDNDFSRWHRANRLGASIGVNAGHAGGYIVAYAPKEFEAHPEYWAGIPQPDGTLKRVGPQFEYANPGLRKLIVDYAIDFFKKNPRADMVSIDPADGFGFSLSPESKKLGTPSEAVFDMANEVGRALKKAYPGQHKYVGLYAYNWHTDPPSFPLEDNVYVQLTMGFIGGNMSLPQLFEEWPKKTKNFGFYDYFSVWQWEGDAWFTPRISHLSYVDEMLGAKGRYMTANAKSGGVITSLSAESGNNFGPAGLGYYIAARKLWNPGESTEALKTDFLEKAFGPAAEPMRNYYAMGEASYRLSPGVYGRAFRYIDEASKAAAGWPEILARINHLKNYLNYVYVRARQPYEKDKEKLASLMRERNSVIYRTRNDNMMQWSAISQLMATPEKWPLEEFDKLGPVTAEETEANFQEALAYFPDLKVPERVSFSTKLLPVRLPGDMLEFKSSAYQAQQGGQTIWMYSSGKPLEVTIQPFATYGGDKHNYSVIDKVTEKEIASGKIALKNSKDEKGVAVWGTTTVTVPVPKPGIYVFKYDDAGSNGIFQVKADQIWSMDPAANYSTQWIPSPPVYFYVPKGNKTIDFYFGPTPWTNAAAFDIINPEGQSVITISKAEEYYSIPVPPGMDGKMWKMATPLKGVGNFGFALYDFFNVPQVVSGSPGAILLPEDVVKRDHLNIIR